jgi:hypothetical protein
MSAHQNALLRVSADGTDARSTAPGPTKLLGPKKMSLTWMVPTWAERERERVRESVCVRERECVCERESVCVRERERERVCV